MSQPEFNPFDPVSAAMGALHQGNLLAAKEAQIANLKAELTDCKAEADRLKAEVERLTELDENSKATIDDRNAYIKQLLFCRPAMEELKAEVERLKAELADEKSANANVEGRLNSANRGLSMRNHLLQAKVERLIKAGDAMSNILIGRITSYEIGHAIDQWDAARDGKGQP